MSLESEILSDLHELLWEHGVPARWKDISLLVLVSRVRHPIDIDYVTKAFVGIASPLLGVITSLQEQVEWTLRVASLVVGLVVGIMSLVSMVKKMRLS